MPRFCFSQSSAEFFAEFRRLKSQSFSFSLAPSLSRSALSPPLPRSLAPSLPRSLAPSLLPPSLSLCSLAPPLRSPPRSPPPAPCPQKRVPGRNQRNYRGRARATLLFMEQNYQAHLKEMQRLVPERIEMELPDISRHILFRLHKF